jgi:DNA-binding MarR family transcriptional regulator
MAEIPFELQKLPNSVLDVMRHFGHTDNTPATEEELAEQTGLSSRSLGKAIKRLVTKKFAEMDVHRRYQLTNKGLQLMERLLAYDEAGGDETAPTDDKAGTTLAQPIERHFSVVVPEPFVANQAAKVYVGLDDGLPAGETELILQIGAVNAEPAQARVTLPVGQGAAYTNFEVIAGEFTEIRLRLEVLQADPYSGDVHQVGGIYVDVDVTMNAQEGGQLSAFGADVTLMP